MEKKKMAMAGKVSVATKISNYRVLKALRAQDAFLPFLFFFFLDRTKLKQWIFWGVPWLKLVPVSADAIQLYSKWDVYTQ